jgi:hypothetical protein
LTAHLRWREEISTIHDGSAAVHAGWLSWPGQQNTWQEHLTDISSALLPKRLFAFAAALSIATFAAMAPTSTAQAESAKRMVPSAVERRGDLARKARRPA